MNTYTYQGEAKSNTGFRQVLLDESFKVRPVAFTIESGPAPKRGTVQVGAQVGDLLLRVEWNSKMQWFEVLERTEDGLKKLPPAEMENIKEAAYEHNPWLREWLQPVDRGGSWLPPETYGGQSLAAQVKRQRCQNALNRFGISMEYDQEWEVSHKSWLNTKPRPLDFNPDTYQPVYKTWDGSVVGIAKKEIFYGSDGNQNSVLLDVRYDEEHGSNYAHEKTQSIEGVPGIPGWRDHRFLVRVIVGYGVRDHHSYGIAFDVWDTSYGC